MKLWLTLWLWQCTSTSTMGGLHMHQKWFARQSLWIWIANNGSQTCRREILTVEFAKVLGFTDSHTYRCVNICFHVLVASLCYMCCDSIMCKLGALSYLSYLSLRWPSHATLLHDSASKLKSFFWDSDHHETQSFPTQGYQFWQTSPTTSIPGYSFSSLLSTHYHVAIKPAITM